MKLIVGLGNPGREYRDTRHNVGFGVAGSLAQKYGGGSPRAKFRGEVLDISVGGERCLILCPHTYMNRSGMSVQEAVSFFKLEPVDVLVVCDDFNLALGRLRCRAKGSSGGQKGLQDIIQRLGTDQFSRLRIGIGTPPPGWNVADYVLSKFKTDELPLVREVIDRAAAAVTDWVCDGVQVCMNRYNADPTAGDRGESAD